MVLIDWDLHYLNHQVNVYAVSDTMNITRKMFVNNAIQDVKHASMLTLSVYLVIHRNLESLWTLLVCVSQIISKMKLLIFALNVILVASIVAEFSLLNAQTAI